MDGLQIIFYILNLLIRQCTHSESVNLDFTNFSCLEILGRAQVTDYILHLDNTSRDRFFPSQCSNFQTFILG